MLPPHLNVVEAVYVGVFTLAAVACFAGVKRAQGMTDPDTRRGLSGLLVLSGAWAGAHVGRLVVSAEAGAVVFYEFGLVVGFATVWAWLYFCSAYAGHTYHRNRTLRLLGLGVFLAVVGVKLTNPLHNLYFETAVASVPFRHLVIEQKTIHWVATGLAYALSAVGFYLLFELFREVEHDAGGLAVLVGLTGVPVFLDIVGSLSSFILIGMNYEPLGVAAFAVGALFVVEDDFLAVPRLGRQRLIQEIDDAVVFLDREDRIRKSNPAANELFPSLPDAKQEQETLLACLPDVAEFLSSEEETLQVVIDGRPRHYVVIENDLTADETNVGRLLLFTDVTQVERQRAELKRQYSQFDRFAAAMDHELRNALTIVRGNLQLAGEISNDPGDVDEYLARIGESTSRIERVVSQLSQFARYQQSDPELQQLHFGETVWSAWNGAETGDTALTVVGDGQLRAEPARLEELFRTAFEFANENDASTVDVELLPDGFAIAGDGTLTAADAPAAAFAYGEPVPSPETGMSLPNVRTLARMLEWDATVDTGYTDGVRILVTGVATTRDPPHGPLVAQ